MSSLVVMVTAATSLVGFVINVLVMLIVLFRGGKRYHLLFAPLLFITACWDLGISLVMIRNAFPDEVLLYQNIVTIPSIFYPVFIFHFTTTYLNQPHRKSTVAIYAYSIFGLVIAAMGGVGASNVYNYEWGTIARYEPNPILLSWTLVYYLSLAFSCWFLFQARKRENSPVTRRHIEYILAGFIVLCIATVKLLVALGVDVAFTLPLGMLLVDSFGALIGIAIVKHQLFDITFILKKGTIYSMLAVIIIFLFSLSEHLVTTYVASIVGELSEYLHFVSIAIVVGAFMPLKHRLDRTVGDFFARKKVTVEF